HPDAAATAAQDGPQAVPHPVVIAGFGRVGQIVARVLRTRNIGFSALDSSPEQIDFVRRYGSKAFYGDATQLEVLRRAGIDEARLLVLAIDDQNASLRCARAVRVRYPKL